MAGMNGSSNIAIHLANGAQSKVPWAPAAIAIERATSCKVHELSLPLVPAGVGTRRTSRLHEKGSVRLHKEPYDHFLSVPGPTQRMLRRCRCRRGMRLKSLDEAQKKRRGDTDAADSC